MIFSLTDAPLKSYNVSCVRGVAQFGSALPWGGRGREFESRRSDQFFRNYTTKINLCGVFLSENWYNNVYVLIN